MQRLDLTLPTLPENLALDEALLLDAQAGGPATLRFWEIGALGVVLGAGGKLGDEVHGERCAADHVPVERRGSGGGTVLLGPGCLLYSLILPMNADPALADLNASYRYISQRCVNALAVALPGIESGGSSDLVWRDRKFSGNAQQRKRTHLLHHGSILDAFDLSLIDRYLKHPARMPDYRRDRPHHDFVANVHLGAERLQALLASAWQATERRADWPADTVARLVHDKYGRDDWRTRR